MRTNTNKIQRCPGCGDFLIHLALKQALAELQIPVHKTTIVTGIGCNSKMSQYLEGYNAETLHGRGIPFATGVKMANPDQIVVSISGDGDSYGIGIGHLIHAARRNLPFVHITCDNQNYALTTGQASATTPVGAKTKSTPEGNQIPPMHPLKVVESAGCQFIRMVADKDIKILKETIKEAIQF